MDIIEKSLLGQNDEDFSSLMQSAGETVIDRFQYHWKKDFLSKNILGTRSNFIETYFNSDYLNRYKHEIRLIIDKHQYLLQSGGFNTPDCELIFGEVNLKTLTLILTFKLTELKNTGLMKIFDSHSPSKSCSYKLNLKNFEFTLKAGLCISGDGFNIKKDTLDFLNYDLALSYKENDESKEIFPLDNVQDLLQRTKMEKNIVNKLTQDIISKIKDEIYNHLTDMSVEALLWNESKKRKKLRLHEERIHSTFVLFAKKIITNLNEQLKNQNITEIKLPDVHGRFFDEKDNEITFNATNGVFKNLASLELDNVIIQEDQADIILIVFFNIFKSNIIYNKLNVDCKSLKQTLTFIQDIEFNSFVSMMRATIKITKKDEVKILNLKNFNTEEIGFEEKSWRVPKNVFEENSLSTCKDELSKWLNNILKDEVSVSIEKVIKKTMEEVLKNQLFTLEFIETSEGDMVIDSSEEEEEEEEEEYDEEGEEDEKEEEEEENEKEKGEPEVEKKKRKQ